MMERWQLVPSIDLTALIGIFVLLALLVCGFYAVEWRFTRHTREGSFGYRVALLWIFRLLGTSLLLVMLARVMLYRSSETASPLWIAIDRSASMLYADQEAKNGVASSRLGIGLQAVEALASKFSETPGAAGSASTKVFWIGDDARIATEESFEEVRAVASEEMLEVNQPSANELTTDERVDGESMLGDCLTQLRVEAIVDQPRALIIVSDGRVTGGRSIKDVWSGLSAKNIPVFSLLAGTEQRQGRINLYLQPLPNTLFVGDQVSITADLTAEGFDRQLVRVSLYDKSSQSILQSQTLSLGERVERQTVTFEYVTEKSGTHELQVVAETVEEENQPAVWAQEDIALRVREDSIPILLVSHGYSYELRYLKHWLERERRAADASKPVYKPTIYITEADRAVAGSDESMVTYLPVTSQWWAQFELCVMIDPAASLIDGTLARRLENEVTENGLGLLMVAGNVNAVSFLQQSPLGDLLPVNSSRTVLELGEPAAWSVTPLAEQGGLRKIHQLFANYLSSASAPPATVAHVADLRPKPNAQVWAWGDQSNRVPVLAYAIAGQGRVAYQNTDEIYLWRNMAGSDLLYEQYWSDVLAAVIKRPVSDVRNVEAQFELSEKRVAFNGRLSFTLRLNQDGSDEIPPRVLVNIVAGTKVVGQTAAAWKGTYYEGMISNLMPGDYDLQLSNEGFSTAVLSRDGVFRVESAVGELEQSAPDFIALRDLSRLTQGMAVPLADWEELMARIPNATTLHFEPLPPKSIWNHPLIVLAAIASFAMEWYLRNRWGLI